MATRDAFIHLFVCQCQICSSFFLPLTCQKSKETLMLAIFVLLLTYPCSSRSLFRRGADGITTIELRNDDERTWLLYFISLDLGNHAIKEVRQSVPVRELCLILGDTQHGDGSTDSGSESTSFSLVRGVYSFSSSQSLIACNSLSHHMLILFHRTWSLWQKIGIPCFTCAVQGQCATLS